MHLWSLNGQWRGTCDEEGGAGGEGVNEASASTCWSECVCFQTRWTNFIEVEVGEVDENMLLMNSGLEVVKAQLWKRRI